MDDRRLLQFYLKRGSQEAQRWNLFPANLAAELASREALIRWVRPSPGMRVCNVGIGVGEWDDFLGYWLEGRGRLTSVDRDRRVCEVFRYRQKRERHPNPSRVVCADFLRLGATRQAYDLVTVIGSTAMEARSYGALLDAGLRALKVEGRFFYLDFLQARRPAEFLAAIKRLGGRLEACLKGGQGEAAYFVALATKRRRAGAFRLLRVP